MGGSYGKYTRAQTIADDVRTAGGTLNGKLVLITGANTGIGIETARALASLGPELVLACRNREKGDAAVESVRQSSKNDNVYAMVLDVASLESVRGFCKDFEAKYPERALDIVINNAGIMALPEYEETVDHYEAQFATNHLGHFLMTNLLLGMIKKSEHARVVNVSSTAHKGCPAVINWERMPPMKDDYSPWGNYGISKISNIWFARELQRRFDEEEKGKHSAFSLHPGVIPTDLFKHTSVFGVMNTLGKLVMKDTQQGAATSVFCAIHPDAEKNRGGYFSDCNAAEADCTDHGKDMSEALKLWELSERLTGLKTAEAAAEAPAEVKQ